MEGKKIVFVNWNSTWHDALPEKQFKRKME